MRKLNPVLTALLFSFSAGYFAIMGGCAHVSSQTAALSAELSGQIGRAKAAHAALIDEYINQRRERADDYMQYIWTPRFIRKFLDKIDFDSEVCQITGKMDRALVVQELVQAITKQVEKRRRTLTRAIDETERDLHKSVRDHYSQTERMNRAITANLQSVARGKDLEREIRKALSKPMEAIAPLINAGKKLDKMLEFDTEDELDKK